MSARLAVPPCYRTLFGIDGGAVGVVLDETTPLTDPVKLERMEAVAAADLTFLTHRGTGDYPLGWHHPTAEWWVDQDGAEYPVAVDLARHLLRPIVSQVAATPWLPSNFRGPRSLLVGLARGVIVTVIAPLAHETTLAELGTQGGRDGS